MPCVLYSSCIHMEKPTLAIFYHWRGALIHRLYTLAAKTPPCSGSPSHSLSQSSHLVHHRFRPIALAAGRLRLPAKRTSSLIAIPSILVGLQTLMLVIPPVPTLPSRPPPLRLPRLVLGPGLLLNPVFKEISSRPRWLSYISLRSM